MIHFWILQDCGCEESYDMRWPRHPVRILLCRTHSARFNVGQWLDGWLTWDRFTEDEYERAAGREILFWASRCSF